MVTVKGYRGNPHGRGPNMTYKMLMLKCKTSENGSVVEGEFKYRENFWTMNRWGKIYRVGNGRSGGHKMHTLCDFASVTTKVK